MPLGRVIASLFLPAEGDVLIEDNRLAARRLVKVLLAERDPMGGCPFVVAKGEPRDESRSLLSLTRAVGACGRVQGPHGHVPEFRS